ncbi:hypothetical protein [Lysinibacillus odysseyi]|uniref:Uncharacterized protein n=1 Tax=Lysinibacillus odysseyi 34hs-1 = NBRC 100172 TaxID=1220589 RepID=A0A0A3ILN6_9BACI|nr:hypothetical protein [Lysinibacillus odysseyi]KGR84355.1 hypothetical protein CD32_12225 [Lysinibacillus odysseyi 34hs-1 = NBRC 100172]
MKKRAGMLSVVFVIISLIPFFLTLYPEAFSEYLFLISVISYFIAIIFALIAEKGVWKVAAITLLVIITVALIAFYAFMGIFWNQP